jgi:cobalamin biosynthesis protein CobD/CbiB
VAVEAAVASAKEGSTKRMTEQPSYTRYRRKRPSTLAVTTKMAAVASAATLALGGGLAWQMSQGGDPALGPKAQAAAASVQPRTKIVKTTIVRRVQAPSASSGSSSSSTASAPVTSSPAPAPAPVVSSSS